MVFITELAQQLSHIQYQGHRFHCLPIAGTQPVIRIEVSCLDSLPIFVSATPTQILCLAYLAHTSEIKPERLSEFNTLLLELNVPMPLSAFALVEDYYVLFGALSVDSDVELIANELVTLAENSQMMLRHIEDFLL